MLLYRPSFIIVIPFIFTLCVAGKINLSTRAYQATYYVDMSTVSAAPQYGRPMFHTMDVDPDKSVVDNSSTTAMSAEPAVASVSAQSAEIVGAPAAADSGNYSGKAVCLSGYILHR